MVVVVRLLCPGLVASVVSPRLRPPCSLAAVFARACRLANRTVRLPFSPPLLAQPLPPVCSARRCVRAAAYNFRSPAVSCIASCEHKSAPSAPPFSLAAAASLLLLPIPRPRPPPLPSPPRPSRLPPPPVRRLPHSARPSPSVRPPRPSPALRACGPCHRRPLPSAPSSPAVAAAHPAGPRVLLPPLARSSPRRRPVRGGVEISHIGRSTTLSKVSLRLSRYSRSRS